MIPNSDSFPLLPPLPSGNQKSFSKSVSPFLFHSYADLCIILDSTYKWYHMVFVILFLTEFF